MALIKCPECGNEVSTSAVACPKCGFPIVNAPSVFETVSHDVTVEDIKSGTDSNNNVVQEPFPVLPTVMNVGKQIANWSFDAAIQDCYYLAEVNYTKYIKEGKVNILAHTNGICINSGLDFFYISHEQLIDLRFVDHKQLISKQKSVIGRAIVGGVLLGPLAAVVGGISGIGTKTKAIGNYLLVITFWDVYTHQVQTIFICTKRESLPFINRVEKEKQKHNIPEGTNYVCNILDDDGKLSDAKTMEALKTVGKMELIKAIGIIDNCGDMTAIQKVNSICSRNNVDSSQFKMKNSGCLMTILMMIGGLMFFVALFFLMVI